MGVHTDTTTSPSRYCVTLKYSNRLFLLVRSKEHICSLHPPILTVDDLVAKPADTPLSQQEDRLATSLVRRKLAQGSLVSLRLEDR